MIMEKKIDFILKGREKSIGEETVLQPLPHKDFRFANPFIVIHHLPVQHYPPGSPPERLHPHPHRGFAPVTFMFQGEGYHKDSEGNSGVLKAGEVQWMFAGHGLLHSEGPTSTLLEKGGPYEFVQIWVNVPAVHKMDQPFYRQASREQMPLIFDEPGIELRLASGSYQNRTGPIASFTPVVSVFGSVQAGKRFSFQATAGYWTLVYLLEGEWLINGQEIHQHHLLIFSKDDIDINLTTLTPGRLLYLSGAPIDEPVAARGNFVMNSQEEIQQAEKDFAEGKFGVLDT